MPQFTITAVSPGETDVEPEEHHPDNFAQATLILADELQHFPKQWGNDLFQEWMRQALYQVFNRGEPEDALNRAEIQVSKRDEEGPWTYTFRYDGRV